MNFKKVKLVENTIFRRVKVIVCHRYFYPFYSNQIFLQLDKMVGGLKKGGGAGGKVTFTIMIAALQHFFELERLKCNLYIANKNSFQPYPPGQLPRPNSLNDFNEVEEEVTLTDAP